MLDPDEFKEMLNSMGQQTPYEQSKGYNNLDTIGGMQVESKLICKIINNMLINLFFCFTDYWSRK